METTSILSPATLRSICDQLKFVSDELKDRAAKIDATIEALHITASTPIPEVTEPAVVRSAEPKRKKNPYSAEIVAAITTYLVRLRASNASAFTSKQLREYLTDRIPQATPTQLNLMTIRLKWLISKGVVRQLTKGRNRSLAASYQVIDISSLQS